MVLIHILKSKILLKFYIPFNMLISIHMKEREHENLFLSFFVAAAIVVIALVWFPALWTKWAFVIAGALLAILSLFYKKCFCGDKK